MFSLELKLYGSKTQYQSIDEAIRTVQFIRNKSLRYWMDNHGVGQKALYAYSTTLRKEFAFVNKLNSMACQASAERAWSAIARFYDNCKKQVKGKKGYPKFKRNVRSVEYKTSGWKLSEDRKKITFTDKNGIGTFKMKGTRDLNYFSLEQIKRVRIVKRADGYYVQFCIKEDIRCIKSQELEPTRHCVGIDVGLKYFYADSDGNIIKIPQFYRKAEKRLNRLNRRKSKKFKRGQKQSNNYLKAKNRSAKKHLRVSRQRRAFAERTALDVIQSNDLIAYEDLRVKNMVKNQTPLSSPLIGGTEGGDAAWSMFRQWLEYFGSKYGKVTVAVVPHNTSQNCSNCGEKVQKTLSTRTHKCPHCGYIEDRDVNAAINILKLGLSTAGHVGTWEPSLKASGEKTSTLVGSDLLEQVSSMNEESHDFSVA